MPSFPQLSETSIRGNATPQSFSRGETYYHQGNVTAVTLRGSTLYAEVFGREAKPYRVTLGFDEGGITSADCTCPYSDDGWCKHIVATNLVMLHQPETIDIRPTLEELLDRLNPVQIKGLVKHLVKEEPELMEEIDLYVSLPTVPEPGTESAPSSRRPPIDPIPFRREVRQILNNALHYLEEGWEEDPLTEELLDMIDRAQGFVEIGDANNALVILEAIASACAADWDRVEDYGADSDEIVAALDNAITEAILSATLTPKEQTQMRSRLEAIQHEWGVEFPISFEALSQGWDYPPLVRVLEGNITEKGAWEDTPFDYADELALIRLKILDRQERYQEYLYLAEAEGQIKQYLVMLGSLGRIEEAMAAAQNEMGTQEEALALSQTLRDRGAVSEALEVAQKGLELPGYCGYKLASWTSDLAEGLGEAEVALEARAIAFKEQTSLADYFKVEELAGENWATVKQELLTALRQSTNWGDTEAKVDIFLHEGLIDEAIASVNDLSYYHTRLIHRVMDEAIAHRPDWVIESARIQAESIIDRGKADAYNHAIQWLKKVRAAYIHSQRHSEWKKYRANLLQVHARKYKLRGMLEQPELA